MALAAWFCAIEVTIIHGKYLKYLSSTFHCRVVNLFMVLLSVFVLSCQKSTTTNMSGPSSPSAPGTTTSGSSGNGGTVTVPPQEGGADGGGGDAGISQKISTEKISKILSELPYILPHILYTLENYNHGKENKFQLFFEKEKHSDPKKAAELFVLLLKKIYTSDAIYFELQKVKYMAQTEGPCKDKNNQDKDASAFNVKENQICISVPRLKARVTELSAFVEVVALAIHELSHRVGANEDEAQVLQFVVVKTFSVVKPDSFSAVSSVWTENGIANSASYRHMEEILVTKKPQDIGNVCSKFGQLHENLRSLLIHSKEMKGSFGFQDMKTSALKALKGSLMQVEYLLGFCDGINQRADIEYMLENRNLKSDEPFPLTALGEFSAFWDGVVPSDLEGFAQLTNLNDWNAALFNFKGLMKNLERAEKIIKDCRETHYPRLPFEVPKP